jgi:hypothetical protein
MSTEFTRQSALLPMNTQGNNLCSFGPEMEDICHVYLNPDKTNVHDFFVTVHLMNRGTKVLEELPYYHNVTIFYDECDYIDSLPLDSIQYYRNMILADHVPYEFFEERDQRTIFRALISNLKPKRNYTLAIGFTQDLFMSMTLKRFVFTSLPVDDDVNIALNSNKLTHIEPLLLKLHNNGTSSVS